MEAKPKPTTYSEPEGIYNEQALQAGFETPLVVGHCRQGL